MLAVQAISPTEKKELLRRIVTSKQFVRSERLSSFLSHICELEIQGRLSELNEKEIGRTVFSLPSDYDPSIDGIVRSHASRLRRKLEMYYLREGRDETIRLMIPRGGYQPQFEWKNPQSPESAATEPEEENLSGREVNPVYSLMPEGGLPRNETMLEESPAPQAGIKRLAGILQKRRVVLAGILIVLVVSAAAFVYHANRVRFEKGLPNSIWAEIFTMQRPTILVPGDSGVVMWQEIMQQNLTLSDYISSISPWRSNTIRLGQEHLSSALVRRRYTSIVDLDIIQKLSHLAYLHQVEPVLRYARDVRPNDLKNSNVVLLGSDETNPWNQMFQAEMNFILRKDQKRMVYTIENRHPTGGEPAQWTSDSLTDLHTVYCKVSYLTNPSGEGNILILEGTSMAGTECAWEFVSSKEELKLFLKRVGWSGTDFPHFEVLLKTNNLAGDSAASNIVAWRTAR